MLSDVAHAMMLATWPPGNELLPHAVSRAEMDARGWDEMDVVFVTGDAYIDHPSFAMALLGRVLEAAGFRVELLRDWLQAVSRWHDISPSTPFQHPQWYDAFHERGYDVELDFTRGELHFGSVSRIRFDCSEPGAGTFLDLVPAHVAGPLKEALAR